MTISQQVKKWIVNLEGEEEEEGEETEMKRWGEKRSFIRYVLRHYVCTLMNLLFLFYVYFRAEMCACLNL